MRVLVIGGGGREHALCWKLRQSPLLDELYCAPGSPGIAEVADCLPTSVDEIQSLAEFAAGLRMDLTVVGPELPLSLGIVDEFQSRGLRIFGPTSRAAELESSKVFAKEFMERHGIPTAPFEVAHDREEVRRAVGQLRLPVVLKANGLAAGKGVLIVRDDEALERALAVFFDERRFGSGGDRVVVERCLEGEEVSMIALSDGAELLALPPSKDYKRIGEGDTGPNTGGMGSHSPSGVLSAEQMAEVDARVLRPVIAGMAAENRRFRGVLYAGLMLTPDGPRVLEFNVRLGDPEAQSLLLRLEDDLLPVLAAAAEGSFGGARLRHRSEAAACIVLAAPGYPGKATGGEAIGGLAAAAAEEGVEIFHAGTALDGERLVSAGGRVLNVCALGADLAAALDRAYRAAEAVDWPGKVLRRDVGRRVIESGASGASL